MGYFNKSDQNEIKKYISDGAKIRKLLSKDVNTIIKASELLVDSFKNGGKLLVCGNGGSAADSQHMVTEFMSRLTRDFIRPAIPSIALTTDTSFLTAYPNDGTFDGIFERQVEGLGKSGDVLIGISTSGNSKNVVKAFKLAKSKNIKTIALIGESGQLSDLSDITISIPSKNTQFIQECHLVVEHLICSLVEKALYKI